MKEKKKIAVLGAGSFGTALAMTLAWKGHDVIQWARRASHIEELKSTHHNEKYLPGIELPSELRFTADIAEALSGRDIALFAVPAQTFRIVLTEAKQYLPDDAIIVNAAKGIEKDSLLRLSEVAEEIAAEHRYVAISGPSHAEEVARRLPTTVVCAAHDHELAVEIQEIFSTDRFRVYTNDDLIGVELGGSLKNIIALGAGISDGLEFGDNAKAAMMTRGMTEMKRLGLALGANAETFSGLAGIGDLIVTCTSMHSRNRRCGILIGKGYSVEDAKKEVGMVVEGLSTAEAANALAARLGVEMPITECIYAMIQGKIDAKNAVEILMGRSKKNEMHI